MHEEQKTRQVRVDSRIHREIKILSARKGVSIKSLFERLVRGEGIEDIAKEKPRKIKKETGKEGF